VEATAEAAATKATEALAAFFRRFEDDKGWVKIKYSSFPAVGVL
jgi:hypothetical protein